MIDGFRHLLPRLLRHPSRLAGSIFFAMISAGGLGVGLVSLGPLLRIILAGEANESASELVRQYNDQRTFLQIPESIVELVPSDPFSAVLLIMAGLAVLTLIGATANFLHQFLAIGLAAEVVAEVRQEVFRHVISMPLGKIQGRGAAELVSRINKDSMALQGGMLALSSKTLAQLTKGLAAFAAAVWFDWRLTIGALVVAPVMAAVLRHLGRRIRKGTRLALEAQEDLLRASNEAIQGIRAVKTAHAEASADRRFERANRSVLDEELRVRTARAISSPLIELLAVFVLIGLAIFACREIIAGRLTFDAFMLSLASLGVAAGSLRPLTGLVNEIQAASAPAERLEDLLAEPDEFALTASLPKLPRHGTSIEFIDVSYSYPGTEQKALDAVSLRIGHGEHVAIVGPNGCGKTTLLALLPRLFDPCQGVVEIDGVDIKSRDLESIRAQIGVVTQESILIRDTIRENIAFGVDVADADIERAALAAHADEFIRAMDDGYQTEVAELGASLSGGQRQRIAIAREVIRDPAFLILDEATSQIDAESEEQINAALEEFGKGRTVLVIAHRLSTVLAADRIVVMDRGRVVGSGQHDDLLGTCEVYRRLASTQLGVA